MPETDNYHSSNLGRTRLFWQDKVIVAPAEIESRLVADFLD